MAKERKNKMNVLTGSAGEYFVAAELSRRGVVAAQGQMLLTFWL